MIDIAALEVARDAVREGRLRDASSIVDGDTRVAMLADAIRMVAALAEGIGARFSIHLNDIPDVDAFRSSLLACGGEPMSPYREPKNERDGDRGWRAASVALGERANLSFYSSITKEESK